MRFAGYAAIFGRPDRGGDVVCAGAFARSLGRGAGAAGREAAALLRDGAVKGLSLGYRVRAAQGEAPRELTDLELVEVSW